VYRQFGPKTLRTYRNSDPGHFGITEVSRVLRMFRHYSLSTYIEDQSNCILCDSFLPLVTLGVSIVLSEFEYYAKAYPLISEN